MIRTDTSNAINDYDSDWRSPHNKNLSLEVRLEIEKTIVHWLPYKRVYYMKRSDGSIYERDCPVRNPAINEFPQGWWTRKFDVNAFCFSVALIN